jgi:hypothetical protein
MQPQLSHAAMKFGAEQLPVTSLQILLQLRLVRQDRSRRQYRRVSKPTVPYELRLAFQV